MSSIGNKGPTNPTDLTPNPHTKIYRKAFLKALQTYPQFAVMQGSYDLYFAVKQISDEGPNTKNLTRLGKDFLLMSGMGHAILAVEVASKAFKSKL